MITVYALTDSGDRFRMLQTHRLQFAHENALKTAHLYVQTVAAYEINDEIFLIDQEPESVFVGNDEYLKDRFDVVYRVKGNKKIFIPKNDGAYSTVRGFFPVKVDMSSPDMMRTPTTSMSE